jgi:Tfp pilus assembly protein PilV
MRHKHSSASGFTIIELLIATLIFTLILILLTTGVMQFTRQYYKGVVSSQTQSTARAILEDVAQAIQFNPGTVSTLTSYTAVPNPAGPPLGYCIGASKRYSFALNKQVVDNSPSAALNQGYHGLVSDSVTGCSSNTPALGIGGATLSTPNARELVARNMRITKFSITQPAGNDGLYTITVRVIYGDQDLLSGGFPNQQCAATAGPSFCAVSELTTTVQKRVN